MLVHNHGSSFGHELLTNGPTPANLPRSDALLQNERSALDLDSLFASALPINPATPVNFALDTTITSKETECCPTMPSRPDGSDSLFASMLPISPAAAEGKATHESCLPGEISLQLNGTARLPLEEADVLTFRYGHDKLSIPRARVH